MQAQLPATDTYGAILSSALHVFSRNGYVESKVEDIAKDAGVNAATVYRHFQDKKTLFLAVVEAYGPLEEEVPGLDARLSYTDVAADLAVLAEGYFRTVYDNIDILQIFMGESCYISKIKDQAWHIPPALVAHFSDYLHRINAKNRSTKKARKLLAEMFLSDIIRYAVAHIYQTEHTHFSDELLRGFHQHMSFQIPCMLTILKRRRFVK